MDILLDEFKELLLLLNKHRVNYMLIGGYAVIYHGFERNTTDMDIWLEPETENRDKLIGALRDFRINEESLASVSKLDFSKIQFFYFGDRPRRIDFLTKISGVTFSEAFPKANQLPLKDEKIPVIHYHHLILSKITSERTKDKLDVEELQRINRYKKKD